MKYTMRNVDCLKLDEVSSCRNRFNEKLRDISEIFDFRTFLEDKRLQTFLNTKLKDLARVSNDFGLSYKYLIPEEMWNSNATMKDYLTLYQEDIKDDELKDTKERILVSEDKTINDLIIYETKVPRIVGGRRDVSDIGVFSFDLNKNNVVLIKDIYRLLVDMMKSYGYIEWSCYRGNPACGAYKKFCDKFNGIYYISPKNTELQVFQIRGDERRYGERLSDSEKEELQESLIRKLNF